MIEIDFQEALEAQKIHKCLHAKAKALSINYITISSEEKVVSIYIAKKYQYVLRSIIIPILTEFIVSHKEDQWVLSIIESMFYFTDYEEKKQILEITKSLLDGSSRRYLSHQIALGGSN